MKASQPCSGCLVHPSMWMRPPTPFAFGPEINGADLDMRGRGLGEMNAEGLQARPGVGEGQRALGLSRWGQFDGVGWSDINFVVNHDRRPLFD